MSGLMNPNFPIYIVSKGRWESRLTSKALDSMSLDYKIIVEEHEYDRYVQAVGEKKTLTLPSKYKNEYDTFWPRSTDGKVGPGAARNFAWDHSISNGFKFHWVMDDNLDAFHRMNRNEKWESRSGAVFRAMEDFTQRFENVAIAGPNYYSFCKTTDAIPPFILNTRIYSCLLIRNDIPYRWRGRYNEDTDICLRALKDGWVTIQFNAFLQGKVTTQRMKGGNTEEFYKEEGTKDKSQILEDMHPDVAKVVWRFGRWHHHVNYKPFKRNIPRLVDGFEIPTGRDEYGMEKTILENQPKSGPNSSE